MIVFSGLVDLWVIIIILCAYHGDHVNRARNADHVAEHVKGLFIL